MLQIFLVYEPELPGRCVCNNELARYMMVVELDGDVRVVRPLGTICAELITFQTWKEVEKNDSN